jgi:uncharacterized protein YabN with tetrapyrrole methylase and pyrophosphatase domain
MELTNLFEKASKMKLRFSTTKGVLSTEDLWDLSLESLDRIAKNLYKQIKESEEISFISEKSSEDTLASIKLEIVKFVITFKMDEAKEKKLRAEKLALKKRIADEIAKKKDNKISEMSIEELEKVYNEL